MADSVSAIIMINSCGARQRNRNATSFNQNQLFLTGLDNEDGFVINTIRLISLPEAIVIFHRMLQDRVADSLRRLSLVLIDNLFDRLPLHLIAAVVNAAANYFKHEPEPDLNPRTIVVLDAFAPRDQNGRRSMHDLLFELLNPEPPGFRTILPLLTQWRDAVMEASKRGGWGSTL